MSQKKINNLKLMNKKFIAIFGALALLATAGAGCGEKTLGNSETQTSNGATVITDMCSQISAEFVGGAIGKSIVKTESGPGQMDYCEYFTTWSEDYYKIPGGNRPGGDYVSLNYENLNVEDQKQGLEYLDRKLETNDKIKMEHFLAIQEDGLINTIDLVLDPDHFVSVNRSSGKVLSEEEVVNFAAKVAEILKKGVEPPKQSESQIDRAKEFFQFLADKKIDEALAMMDANDGTKNMWKTNFKTINSLSVRGANPVFLEEWTSVRQVFKVDLTVRVTPEGEGYGWNQGQNFRWITLEKNGETWQVHELANNP
jgi:hypothetical protein